LISNQKNTELFLGSEEDGRMKVCRASIIMISSVLKDSSDGLDAVSVQTIERITYKTTPPPPQYKTPC
jgi:hypothetical protein